MKKLTSLLIGCSLALAGAALAQQPVEQQSPSKGKHPPEKAHATQAQPKPNAAKSQAPPATHQGATQQHGTAHDADAMKGPAAAAPKTSTNPEAPAAGAAGAAGAGAASSVPGAGQQNAQAKAGGK